MSFHRIFTVIFVIILSTIVKKSLFVHVTEGEDLLCCVIIQPVEPVLDPE
jgi:hypothetical protein